jgi:hypothetical protein
MKISAGSIREIGVVIKVVARLAASLALVITVAAILLGRYVEPLVGRVPGRVSVARAVHIQDVISFREAHANKFFDPETGASVRVALPMSDRFGPIGLAPASGVGGVHRAAGFYALDHGEEGVGTHRLVIFGVPDGAEIDRIPLEVIPTSDPCWAPDGSDRIVFSAFNGRLYEYRRRGKSGVFVHQLGLGPALSPGSIGQIRDLCWSTDPRLEGRLLVTVRLPAKVAGKEIPPYQLAWMQLDPEDGSILACVPLDRWAPVQNCERRFPTVGRSPNGGIQVAFLSKFDKRGPWFLELAELTVGAPGGPLVMVKGSERVVARDVHPTPVAFSADGQFITYVPVIEPNLRPGNPTRIALAERPATIVAGR